MNYEVVSEPFTAREEHKGGFAKSRLYVTVRYTDGRTERKLAAEVKKDQEAVAKSTETKPSKDGEKA